MTSPSAAFLPAGINATRAIEQACALAGLPQGDLAVLRYGRRSIGFLDETHVIHFAPFPLDYSGVARSELGLTQLRREGRVIQAISAHFDGSGYDVPKVVDEIETPAGLSQIRTRVCGNNLHTQISALREDKQTMRHVCSDLGQMIAHLHAAPSTTLSNLLPAPLLLRETQAKLYLQIKGWLRHGRIGSSNEHVSPALLQQADRLIDFGLCAQPLTFQFVPTHGDLHGGNIIANPYGVGCIDFERACFDLPEHDIARLYPLNRGEREWVVSAYEGVSGRALDRKLIAFYRLYDLAAELSCAAQKQKFINTPSVSCRWLGHCVAEYQAALNLPEGRSDFSSAKSRKSLTNPLAQP